MKQEIKDKNKAVRERIKELEAENLELEGKNQKIMDEGQKMNQEMAMHNTRRIQITGAIEELKRQIA